MLTITAILSPLIALIFPKSWQIQVIGCLCLMWGFQFRYGVVGDYPQFVFEWSVVGIGIQGWSVGFLFTLGLSFLVLKPQNNTIAQAVGALALLSALTPVSFMLSSLFLLVACQEKPWRWIAMAVGFGIAQATSHPIGELLALSFLWLPWLWPFCAPIGKPMEDAFCRPILLCVLWYLTLGALSNGAAMGAPLFIGLNVAGAMIGALQTWGPPHQRQSGWVLFWISIALVGLSTQTFSGLDGAVMLLTLMPILFSFSLRTGQGTGLSGSFPLLGFIGMTLICLGTLGSVWSTGPIWGALLMLAWTCLTIRWTRQQGGLRPRLRPMLKRTLMIPLIGVILFPNAIMGPIQETTNQIMGKLKPSHISLQNGHLPSWIWPSTQQPEHDVHEDH